MFVNDKVSEMSFCLQPEAHSHRNQPLHLMTPRPTKNTARLSCNRYVFPLLALTRREISKRYASTWLGTLWTVLQPLLMMAIYLTLFGVILRQGRTIEDTRLFALYLLAGLAPFQAMADGLHRACGCLREDQSLMTYETFPAAVIPVSRILTASIPEAVSLLLLGIAAHAWTDNGQPLGLLSLPLLMVLRIFMTCGLAWLISVLAIFAADVGEVLSFLLTGWMFVTPIFYTPEQLPSALTWTLDLNPLYHIIHGYRAALFDEPFPLRALTGTTAWSLGISGVGLWFFRLSINRAKDFL